LVKIIEFNHPIVILESIINSYFMIQRGQRMVDFRELLRNVKTFKNSYCNNLY